MLNSVDQHVAIPQTSSKRRAKFFNIGQWYLVPATYETIQAPPATVFLQDRHSQMPTALRFTEFFPQNVQMYRACWVISIFFTCFRNEAPYLMRDSRLRQPFSL